MTGILTSIILIAVMMPFRVEAGAATVECPDLAAQGKIIPRKVVAVKSGVFGVIEDVYVKSGDEVERGDVLAKVRFIPDYGKLQQAESELSEANLELAHAKATLTRVEGLYKANSVSDTEYGKALLDQNLKNLAVNNAEDKIQLILTGSTKHGKDVFNLVKATHKGTVIEVSQGAGDFITAANDFNPGTTIAQIADMKDFVFDGYICEERLREISVGDKILIMLKAYPKLELGAEIESISYVSVENAGNVQFRFRASIKNDTKSLLRAGLSAQSIIPYDDK